MNASCIQIKGELEEQGYPGWALVLCSSSIKSLLFMSNRGDREGQGIK
jgi:hypothetical protein